MGIFQELNSNFIGLFDSGFGGISVLNRCIELMPNENYIFYADSKNCPYGKRTTSNLIEIGMDIISKFNKYSPKSLIIACNTMSTSNPTALRSPFPHINIIGTYPNFEHIFKKGLIIENNLYSFNSEVGLNIKKERVKILILATTATSKSKYLNDKIDLYKKFVDIYVVPADIIVHAVENDEVDSFRFFNELENLILPFRDANYMILGCTHFLFAEKIIRKIMNDSVSISSGGEIAANECYEYINSQKKSSSKDNINKRKIVIVDATLNEKRKNIFLKLINNDNNKYEIVWKNDLVD